MPQLLEISGDQYAVTRIPAEATAGNADQWPLFVALANLLITKVLWVPDVAVTGTVTNFFSLGLVNVTGPVAITTVKDYLNGVNSVASVAETFPLSAVANAQNAVAGDVIALARTKTGTGLASPAGTLQVQYRWR